LRTLLRTAAVHDELVWIGSGEQRHLVRFVQALYRGKWYRYLSNQQVLNFRPMAQEFQNNERNYRSLFFPLLLCTLLAPKSRSLPIFW
jgi:hypothetical protein